MLPSRGGALNDNVSRLQLLKITPLYEPIDQDAALCFVFEPATPIAFVWGQLKKL